MEIYYILYLPNAAKFTSNYSLCNFLNVNNAGVQKNVIGINGLADLSFFSPQLIMVL